MAVVCDDPIVKCKATYKILILGDSNVGKTCIVHRYCDDTYYDTYISTIGVDFKQKIVQLDTIPIKLQIWDTAGQERFRTLTTAYYRGAMGILLVYDVTNIESFNHLMYWVKTIEENACPNVVKVLAGNKCDAVNERTVERSNGQMMAETFEMPFFEISCKQNINIEAAFSTLTQMIRERIKENLLETDSPVSSSPSLSEDKNIILDSIKNSFNKNYSDQKYNCSAC